MTRPTAPPPKPLPLAGWPAGARAGIVGVMTDIDDTLTRDGAIEPVALEALRALDAAGIAVVAITGRPHGWSLPFARDWPVAAIVAENGAVALLREGDTVRTEFAQDAATRAANARRLQATAVRILREVPGATLARDSAGRLTDIAVDHSEFTTLAPDTIAHVVALMRAEGMTATVSSIHVNGWYGTHSKWSGAQWMLRRLFGRELEPELARWVYVGDSTNDQVMFERFPASVGVANLMRFAAELAHWPAWITSGERGEGFAELAQALLQARTPQGRDSPASASSAIAGFSGTAERFQVRTGP
jgi:HAD superfamily hydrolase (TIGR01484 family)